MKTNRSTLSILPIFSRMTFRWMFGVLIGVLFSCSGNEQPTVVTEKRTTASSTTTEEPATVSKIEDNTPQFDTLRAAASGTIEWLSKKEKVSRGENLFQLDNKQAFESLNLQKKHCRFLIDSLIANCPENLNPVLNKWRNFSASLRFDTLTPEFPKIQFREEAEHFSSRDLVNAYNATVKKERGMKGNFGIANRSYVKIDWKIKKGQKVKKNQVIAIGEVKR